MTHRFLPFLSTCLLSGLLQAQDTAADANLAAANALAAILDTTHTLQADVAVLTLDQDGREIQESSARLVMQKPDHFSWEITSPYTELMLTDGDRIWRYEPDLEQVTIEYFSDDVGRTPVLLLNGNAEDITANYAVSAVTTDARGGSHFILYPRGNEGLFTRLSLTFTGNDLVEMHFEDSLGQKTSLSFANLQTNTALPADTFVFEMPDAIDVIDNTL